MNNQYIKYLILFLILIVYSFSFYYTIKNPDIIYTGDAKEYIAVANNILQHHTVYCGDLSKNIDPALYSRRPPLYPLVISIPIYLSGGHITILFLQISIMLLGAICLIKILNLLHISQIWQIITILLYMLCPTQIIYTNIIMAEILLQLTIIITTLFFIKYIQEKKLVYLFYVNICLGCLILIKPVFLFFWIPNLLFHFGLFLKNSKKIILLFPFVFIIILSAWSYRNYHLTGVYQYSSIKNHNLLYYNLRGFLANQTGIDHADQIIDSIREEANNLSTYKNYTNFIEQKSYDILKANIFKYSIFHFRGIINFFIDPGRFDIYNFLQYEHSHNLSKLFNQYGYKNIFLIIKEMPFIIIIYFIVMILLNILLFISLINFYFVKNIDIFVKIFILILVLYVAIMTGPLGASRFRLPIYPLLLLTVPFIKWGKLKEIYAKKSLH